MYVYIYNNGTINFPESCIKFVSVVGFKSPFQKYFKE